MDYLSIAMQQNVAVVPILDLHEVHDQTVGCKALHKPRLSLMQIFKKKGLEELL